MNLCYWHCRFVVDLCSFQLVAVVVAFLHSCGHETDEQWNILSSMLTVYIMYIMRKNCVHLCTRFWMFSICIASLLWPPYGVGQAIILLPCGFFFFFFFFFMVALCNRADHCIFTGSIARSANLPVFSLLRGRFWGISPRRGETLHRWGWNLAWPNFTPIGATTRV